MSNPTKIVSVVYKYLVSLINETESMDDTEKQYWFDLLDGNIKNLDECMTDEQIDKLKNILETEKTKLKELEVKYGKKIKDLNKRHLIEWQELQGTLSDKTI